MNEKVAVSVLVMTKNEERNIRQCLESVKWAQEIWIVDTQSTDKTIEIVRDYTDKVVQFYWDGKFPKKKNWAIMNIKFSHEWVLMLDADEIAPHSLEEEVTKIVSGENKLAGYMARFDYYFLGRLLRYGDPVAKLVLFKRRLTKFEQLDDSGLDYRVEVEVHEHPIVGGQIGVLKSRIFHNDLRDLSYYFDRHNRYSSWEAYLIAKGRYAGEGTDAIKPGIRNGGLEARRAFKYIFLHLPMKPVIYFLYAYIFRLGFLDGYQGLAYNACKAFYFFQIGLKTKEFKMRERER